MSSSRAPFRRSVHLTQRAGDAAGLLGAFQLRRFAAGALTAWVTLGLTACATEDDPGTAMGALSASNSNSVTAPVPSDTLPTNTGTNIAPTTTAPTTTATQTATATATATGTPTVTTPATTQMPTSSATEMPSPGPTAAGGAIDPGDDATADDGAGGDTTDDTDGEAGAPAGTAGGESAIAPMEAGAPTNSDGYQPCPDSEPCKILPLGDSITEGMPDFNGGYRVGLFGLAVKAGKSITFVGSRSNGPDMVEGQPFPIAHEGTSGIKIGDLDTQKVPSPALDDGAHIILLHIGTNDMLQDASGAETRLGTLIDNLIEAAPDALLVVSNIIPLPFGTDAVKAYNMQVVSVVQQRLDAGKHVLFVDQFTGFPESELADMVHPTNAGYDRMAGVWYEAISQYLK